MGPLGRTQQSTVGAENGDSFLLIICAVVNDSRKHPRSLLKAPHQPVAGLGTLSYSSPLSQTPMGRILPAPVVPTHRDPRLWAEGTTRPDTFSNSRLEEVSL